MISEIAFFLNFSQSEISLRAGIIAVLCKTCSVLLCVLEQLRVDNSNVGPNWEQLVQLA
jgi:hypothetical protein